MKKNEVKKVGEVIKEKTAKVMEANMAARIAVITPPQLSKSTKTETEKLQEEIDRKTAELQKKLAELAEKQKLNKHRTRFLETLDSLKDFERKLSEEVDFETKICKITFYHQENYRENEVFSISSVPVLQELIPYLCGKIKTKVTDLENQILL